MLSLCSLNSMILHLYSLKCNSILSMDMNNKIRKNKAPKFSFRIRAIFLVLKHVLIQYLLMRVPLKRNGVAMFLSAI